MTTTPTTDTPATAETTAAPSSSTPATGTPVTETAPPAAPPPAPEPHPNAPPAATASSSTAPPRGPQPMPDQPMPETKGTPSSAVRGPLPFEPTSADDLWRYAVMLAPSPMVASGIRGNPSGVMHLLMVGRSLGLTIPMSLQIYIIEGKPSLPAQTILAICKAHPLCAAFNLVESTMERAVFRAARRDIRTGQIVEDVTLDFTIEEAQPLIDRAKRNPEKSAWGAQPKTMMRWRCISSLARVVFPDVIGGIAGSTEELTDALEAEGGKVKTVSIPTTEITGAKDANPAAPGATPAPPRVTSIPVRPIDATSLGLPDGHPDAMDAAFAEVARPRTDEREPVPASRPAAPTRTGPSSRIADRAALARKPPADLFGGGGQDDDGSLFPCANCGAPVVEVRGADCPACAGSR